MTVLAIAALLAISRAELIERFKAPVITQADGLVKVYADCPEDMRREFQSPIASFAAETVKTMYRSYSTRPTRFASPGIAIHVGNVRTNDSTVVAHATTNGAKVVTRIYVRAPGSADLARLRLEIVKAFCRCARGEELSDEEAVSAYRAGDPSMRVEDERWKLEEWLATGRGANDDEENLKLMRKIIEPGVASRRDVLIFASRLYLYPPLYDLRFAGRYDGITFRDAVRLAPYIPAIRMLALRKASWISACGGGRGDAMTAAASAYTHFLLALAKGEADEAELLRLLDDADTLLNVAYEKSRPL